jgi:TonB family protein
MRQLMALLLLGLCAGCAKQTKNANVATAPTINQQSTTKTVEIDLTKVEPTPEAKPIRTAEEAAASDHPVKVSSSIESGLLLNRPVRLAYPAEAKAKHLSGRVLFRAVIAANGDVMGLTVKQATDPVFVPAAIAAVQSWQYKPYTLNGSPVAVDTTITVNFMMSN